jgi:hypothetical protein
VGSWGVGSAARDMVLNRLNSYVVFDGVPSVYGQLTTMELVFGDAPPQEVPNFSKLPRHNFT